MMKEIFRRLLSFMVLGAAMVLVLPVAHALTPVQQATQDGLSYMEDHAVPWRANNGGCVGCHVQGAAIKALSVGVEKGYIVDPGSLPSLIADLKAHTLPSGEVDWQTAGTAWAAFGLRYYQKYASGKPDGVGGFYADELAYLNQLVQLGANSLLVYGQSTILQERFIRLNPPNKFYEHAISQKRGQFNL